MQEHHFGQRVPQKGTKNKTKENDILNQSAFLNSSTSHSPLNIRNHVPNSPSPLTPTLRRASGGDRNRGSMRKVLPALPDMDTQV